ncbi:hypothetical protein BIY24_04740 [Halobacteriovorax marinus]|uniref:Treble clef zinc finger domain-containing protein n=1 Tax=Halobacteriovorax marinus (strain ATCC BAA-682 / DSM 15412 / SJ) TaxID=862908 RepID=E1WXT3_HALMS|nr:hypothetical protein [Halobacteriovorax marinus]ATH07265.1 hypothetical protein BIY24_04740 [Halobacteriovorax marinus]CBW25890.1 hypothetical protein BMS_1006 [Halobacteriovorax marinus SJ]
MSKQRRVFDLDILDEFAELKGGRLLSNEYKNSTSYLLWECKNGHRWKATALEVMGKKSAEGSWCPKCKSTQDGLQLNLDDIEIDDYEEEN